MKRNLKNCCLILLCIAMVFSTAACGKKGEEEPLSDEVLGTEIIGGDDASVEFTDPTDANAESANGKKEVVNNCYTTGFPFAKKKVTFKIMCVDYSGGINYAKMPFTKFVEQKFNIKLEFTTITPEQSGEKVTLAYSSGTMPDMFWGIGLAGTDTHYKYAKEGRCRNLQDYLDKYMPNLKKVFADEPKAKYACTYSDGKIYTAPLIRRDNLFTDPLYINKTWLSKLGLSMPKTTAELTNVLRAFKNNDPNGNGKKDEIPMAFVEDIPYGIYGMFGLSTYNAYTLNSAGRVVYPFVTDEYRNALKYVSGLYSEGLLYNTEMRNFTAPKAKSMIGASVPLIGIINSGNYSSVMSSENFVNNYTIMPIIDGTGSGKATWGYKNTEQIWSNWGVITSNCKYPEIAARLLDYFYSEEGSIVAQYGPPGDKLYWKYDGNGKPIYNNNNLKFTSLTPGHAVPRYVREKPFFTNEKKGKTDVDTTAIKAEEALKTKYFSNVSKGLYGLTYTDSERKALNNVSNDLLFTVVEWRMGFVVGKRNIDSEWNSYVSTINHLGVDKATQIYQQAYERQQKTVK